MYLINKEGIMEIDDLEMIVEGSYFFGIKKQKDKISI